MEAGKYYYSGQYIYTEEAKEFSEKYLGNLSDEIKKNPKFLNMLADELRFLVETSNVSKFVPPLSVVVYDDGKGFEIRGGIRPNPDCWNPDLKDNKNYRHVRFTLGDNNFLEIERLNGTFYKTQNYKGSDKFVNFVKNRIRDVPTTISVNHRHRCVSPNGIEVESSYYSDTYPLSCDFYSDESLVSQTLIHAPEKWNFNVLPDSPRWEFEPFVVKAFRYMQTLGLVDVMAKGSERNTYEVYCAGTEYPELLTTNPNPAFTYDGGKKMVTPYYQSYYPNMTCMQVETEIMKGFYKGIKTSRTREIDEVSYENILEATKEALESGYGIDTNELEDQRERA